MQNDLYSYQERMEKGNRGNTSNLEVRYSRRDQEHTSWVNGCRYVLFHLFVKQMKYFSGNRIFMPLSLLMYCMI